VSNVQRRRLLVLLLLLLARMMMFSVVNDAIVGRVWLYNTETGTLARPLEAQQYSLASS